MRIVSFTFLCLVILLGNSVNDSELFSSFSNRLKSRDMTDDTLINKPASVSGRFYPFSKKALLDSLNKYFTEAKPSLQFDKIAALISPHAGYVYSGMVAASAYKQLNRKKVYDNIFILGSSHRANYEFASIYTEGNFQTPLGTASVNRKVAKEISRDNPNLFKSFPEPFIDEHSIEVQIPFLQYLYKDKLRIIPILLGTQNKAICQEIAIALKPYFNETNLFVVSSDFSHFPVYKTANIVDLETADAILKNSPQEFSQVISKHEQKGYSGLLTSACGWTSIFTLLYMTVPGDSFKYIKIDYRNSGDSPFGEMDRVVGYNAIIVTRNDKSDLASGTPDFNLSDADKRKLLKISRESIANYISDNKATTIDVDNLTTTLKQKTGVFVTIRKNSELRGCIGRFSSEAPLYSLVEEMSISAAFRDYRFTPLQADEINDIDIEISVLTPLHRINSVDEIELGRHGIYIKKGKSTGTFLPGVALESGWTKEEFLRHCSHDKAGLGWDGWKDAELFTYEAFVFSEKSQQQVK